MNKTFVIGTLLVIGLNACTSKVDNKDKTIETDFFKCDYAGFFFAMSGAVFSHVASGDGAKDFFGPILLIILTVASWYFRPADRKIISANP